MHFSESLAESLSTGVGIQPKTSIDCLSHRFEHLGRRRVWILIGIEFDQPFDSRLFTGSVRLDAPYQGSNPLIFGCRRTRHEKILWDGQQINNDGFRRIARGHPGLPFLQMPARLAMPWSDDLDHTRQHWCVAGTDPRSTQEKRRPLRR